MAVSPLDRGAGMIILVNEAADRNAREVVYQRKQRSPDLAADILEIDVYALRAGRGKLRGKVWRLMIDDRVEPQFVAHERAFVRPSHDADSTRALDPGDLADDRSHCAAGSRVDHGFAGLGLADRHHPRIDRKGRRLNSIN